MLHGVELKVVGLSVTELKLVSDGVRIRETVFKWWRDKSELKFASKRRFISKATL